MHLERAGQSTQSRIHFWSRIENLCTAQRRGRDGPPKVGKAALAKTGSQDIMFHKLKRR